MSGARRVTAEFVYFGFSFVRYEFSISDQLSVVELDGHDIQSSEKTTWNKMMDDIDSDIKKFNKACIGAEDTSFDRWERDGDFVKSDARNHSRYLFYYLSVIYICRSSSVIDYNIELCKQHNHRDVHHQLLPFFPDNRTLILEYKQAQSISDSPFLREALEKLNSGNLKDSEFVANSARRNSWVHEGARPWWWGGKNS